MAEDEPQRPSGPIMLAATSVLRPPKTRIGKIGGNVTLPRTVALSSLIAGGVGGFFGMVFGVLIGGVTGLLYGALFGGGIGVFLVSYSPMKGEPMLRWLGLTLQHSRRRVTIDGKAVRPAIGIAPISRAPLGDVLIKRGAIDVPPSQYDDRGVALSWRNKNFSEAGTSIDLEALLEDDEPPRRLRRKGRKKAPVVEAEVTPALPTAAQASRLSAYRHAGGYPEDIYDSEFDEDEDEDEPYVPEVAVAPQAPQRPAFTRPPPQQAPAGPVGPPQTRPQPVPQPAPQAPPPQVPAPQPAAPQPAPAGQSRLAAFRAAQQGQLPPQ